MTFSTSRPWLWAGLGLAMLAACARQPHASITANLFADNTLQQIGAAQDERNTTVLRPFLNNPTYRRAAAEALGSVQDRAAVPALLPLLRDAQPAVRRAAAYALGQTGDSLAVDSLRVRVLKEPNPSVRRAVHAALGRCVTAHSLPELWRVEVLTDTARAAALAHGLSRAALRGLSSAEAIRRTVLLLNTFKLDDRSRLLAATALARARGHDADLTRLAGPVLLQLVAKDKYYAVRAAAASALGKVAALKKPTTAETTPPLAEPNLIPLAAAALANLAQHDVDYRVRLSAIRALPFGAETYSTSRPAVFAALKDGRAAVALTAAEWLLAHGTGESAADLLARAGKIDQWRVQSTLQAAAIKAASPAEKAAVSQAVFSFKEQRQRSPYEMGYLLQALGEDASAQNYNLVKETMALHKSSPIVMGYGLAALVAMRRSPTFPAEKKGDFVYALRQALASGDVSQIGTAAEALADPVLTPNPEAEDFAALRAAQAKLKLPGEIETWQTIQQTLDKLEKAPKPTPAPIANASQHPIDWTVVRSVAENQRVLIRTAKGDITLALLVNEAPGAVANFVALVRQKFYDGLYFHRVVPNFVAQGGDPRGDGSGGLPYTLRSEFADLVYQEGSVGLASAGKDTESCQFFITHTPTPHLDGRYPIFAQVVAGMDVVHKLEIGDKMLTVQLVEVLP